MALKQAQIASDGKAVYDNVIYIRIAAEDAAALELSIHKDALAVMSTNAERLAIESAAGDALIGNAALKSLASRASDTLVISFLHSSGADTASGGLLSGGADTASGGSMSGSVAATATLGGVTTTSGVGSAAHPALSFSMRFGDKEISSFGGAVIAGLHYKKASGEDAARLFARSGSASSAGGTTAIAPPAGSAGETTALTSNGDSAGEPSAWILYSMFDSSSERMRVICSARTSFTIDHAEESFSDISGHWAETYIEFLAARDSVHGVAPGEFKPGGEISRAGLIQMLYNLSAYGTSSKPTALGESASGFEDVSQSAWYASALAWAKNQGIITGEKTATGCAFRPNDTISRQELAVIFERYMNIAEWPPVAAVSAATAGASVSTNSLAPGGVNTTAAAADTTAAKTVVAAATSTDAPGTSRAFSDNDSISTYAAYAVEHMQKLGILSGIANGDGSFSFQPNKNTSRAEAAKVTSLLVINAFF